MPLFPARSLTGCGDRRLLSLLPLPHAAAAAARPGHLRFVDEDADPSHPTPPAWPAAPAAMMNASAVATTVSAAAGRPRAGRAFLPRPPPLAAVALAPAELQSPSEAEPGAA